MRLAGRPHVRPVTRVALAVASGVAVWASFPPLSWWWTAPLGVAGLALLTRSSPRLRGGVGLGYLHGLGYLVPMMSFLRGIGVDAWLVVALIEAVWFAVLGAALTLVGRRAWWPLALPVIWLAVEWVRDRWPFGGFPWARLAFGQDSGPLLPLAAWGGAPLVAFAVLALAAVLAWAIVRAASAEPSARRVVLAGSGTSVAVVCAAAFGLAAAVPVPTGGTSAHGAPSHTVVAAVQGDVPRLGLDAFTQKRVVTQNHVTETEKLAAEVQAGQVPRPAFVVWPENASDQDPFTDPVARSLIDTAVATVGVPVLVGAVINGPDSRHVQNAAIVWSPATGPGEIYLKRHLVPFGEYLPFRGLLTSIAGRFSMIAKDFSAGHRPGVLSLAGVRIGDVICFEVADDQVVRDTITGGGRLLVVQTNNATYERPGDNGYGGETAQQLAMSRLRAVEHGRAVVVAATSGVSAVISPDGHVLQRSGVFTPALLVADVPLRDPRTVADRLGAWPERIAALLGALAVAAGAAGLWRRHDAAPPARPVAEPDLLAGRA